MRHQGLLVAIPEAGGIEGLQLAVENLRGKPEHVGRRGQLRNVGEIVLAVAHLIDDAFIVHLLFKYLGTVEFDFRDRRDTGDRFARVQR